MSRSPVDPIQRDAPSCSELLRALGEETRLEIVRVLMDGPRHVYELGDELEIEQSLLSHHLRALRQAGIVQAERDGKAVLYSLTPGVTVPRAGKDRIDLGCCQIKFR